MEKFSIQSGLGNVKWIYSELQRRITVTVAHVFDAFKEPELLPIPSEWYMPDREFVENFCAKRGIRGGIITQGDHDTLLASLRGYNFSDVVINETRNKLNAHDFWDTDLPPISK